VKKLPRAFYNRPTLVVAEALIGKVLVHRSPAGLTSGAIVEVEAYVGEGDPACHAAPGPTARNQPLYGPPGFAYVYLNYGIHSLVNVVTESEGAPAAVLIRALEPLDGTALMRRRRGRTGEDVDLCRGPGNLTRAMGITLRDNRADLCGGVLYVEDRGGPLRQICWSTRVGISAGVDRPWRCFDRASAAVSVLRFGSRSRGRSRLSTDGFRPPVPDGV
jgi:DNA-3-methyladenine glycosylase